MRFRFSAPDEEAQRESARWLMGILIAITLGLLAYGAFSNEQTAKKQLARPGPQQQAAAGQIR